MLEKLLEFLKPLLPDENLPTQDYVIRILINFFLAFCAAAFIFYLINNTILAERMGLSKMERELPLLSHVELLRDFQTLRQEMKQFSDTYEEIKTTFIIMFVDNKIGNVVTNNPNIETADTLIWTVTTYKGGEDNLYILDETIRKFKGTLIKQINLNCYSDAISKTELSKDRTLQRSKVTHFVACPLFSKRRYLIGFTLSFLSFPEEIVSPPSTAGIVIEDTAHTIGVWAFEDRLLRLTKFIESYFRGFETQYRVYYN